MENVLIADISAVSSAFQKDILRYSKCCKFCGDARTESELADKIKRLKPDALILDSAIFGGKRIESVFSIIRSYRIPVLVYVPKKIEGYQTPAGVYVAVKPDFLNCNQEKFIYYADFFDRTIGKLKHELFAGKFEKINAATIVEKNFSNTKKFEAVCIGVSTGGPVTLQQLLKDFDRTFPLPIFITQHIDSFFDKNLITWLKNDLKIPVHLAKNNVVPEPGNVYFAPSDFHLTFQRNLNGKCEMILNHDEPVNFLRPAVDKMFVSAAEVYKDKCIGVLLTGMGNDGAYGCCVLKKSGSYTITQDEESCVIYGMPKAAYEAGGSMEVLPLSKISERIKQLGRN